MNDNEVIELQKRFISAGKLGCIFATVLVRKAESIGWEFQVNPDQLVIPKNCHILSIIFPDGDIHTTKQWQLIIICT